MTTQGVLPATDPTADFVIKMHLRRHIFHQLRFKTRFILGPTFLAFSLVDFLYVPELLIPWMVMRLGFVVAIFVGFQLCAKLVFFRKNIEWVAAAITLVGTIIIQKMILDSGGYKSLYPMGLILVVNVGLRTFRLRMAPALFVQAFSYLPIGLIILAVTPPEAMRFAFIQGSFFLTMAFLAYLNVKDDHGVNQMWGRFKTVAKRELLRHERTEFLKSHFPKLIREQIEAGNFHVGKQIIPTAVIGFADISSSTAIANEIPLEQDWRLKEMFLEAATKRAIETDMVVLTHLGDGFLFMANFNQDSVWHPKLVSFFEKLVEDFEGICHEISVDRKKFNTGVKFGISKGPAMVGFLGHGQAYYTAIGPDVNLAARLCSQAKPNEIVMSGRVWNSIAHLVRDWSPRSVKYDSLKGFEQPIEGFHISPTLGLEKTAS